MILNNKLFCAMAVLVCCVHYSSAQVGINTVDPKATLDVVGQPTELSSADGIIPPRMTGVQLRLKNSAYNTNQDGAIVYITTADTAPAGKTINVTSPGYYYYDATNSIWQTLKGGSTSNSLVTASNGLHASNNNIKLGGLIIEPTTITSSNSNKLSFVGTGLDAINFNGNTLSIDGTNGRVGLKTTAPKAALHVEGDLIVKDTDPKSSNNNGLIPLFVDTDGHVVKANPAEVSSRIFVIQTNQTIINNSNQSALMIFNNGTAQTLSLQPAEITLNTLSATIQNGYIRLAEAGVYQISSLINFQFATAAAGHKVFINLFIESSSNNGATWLPVIGYRPIFTIDWYGGQNTPAVLPTATTSLPEGTLLRYRFHRTWADGTLQGNPLTSLSVDMGHLTPSVAISIVKL